MPLLDRVLSVASRPGRCPHAPCAGSRLRRRSAEGQRIAVPGSSYGDDGLVRMDWGQPEHRTSFGEMPTARTSQVRLSESHGCYLSQQVSLPLLACHERQHQDHLAHIVTPLGGVIVALDGLAPQRGEPHMWCIRALSRGLPFRRGGLSHLDQVSFEAFLAPLKPRDRPILAVLSAKPTGWVPAVVTVLPACRHQCGQAHSLRHLVAPLAETDAACKGALRKHERQQVGAVSRQESQAAHGYGGVLPVTGLMPSPGEEPKTPASQRPTPLVSPTALEPDTDAVRTPLWHHTHSLLTLKGRQPLRLAGVETCERLKQVARCRLERLAQRYEPRLVQLSQGFPSALGPCAETDQEGQQGAACSATSHTSEHPRLRTP